MPPKSEMPKNGTVAPTAPLRTPEPPRVVKPVPITLDRERHMLLDFVGMDAFEEATGLSAWEAEAWQRPTPKILGALIWASLIWEDPDLTLDACKRLDGMQLANMAYLSDRLGELWGVTMPDPDPNAVQAASARGEGGDDDPNPSARPAG